VHYYFLGPFPGGNCGELLGDWTGPRKGTAELYWPTHKFAMQGLPTIEGWLDKQGGVRKSWKRRYFVLDGKKLKYFKQQKDAPSKPIDFILLDVRRSFLVQAATSCFQSLKIGANRTIVLRFFISHCPFMSQRTSKIIYIRDKVRPTDPSPGCGFAVETPSRTPPPLHLFISFFVHLFYLFVNSCAAVPKALRVLAFALSVTGN